ncbi:putative mariner transposase [Trichonephila clavipes]|nr:putative mariner transposase [Trichonephila clavipes]
MSFPQRQCDRAYSTMFVKRFLAKCSIPALEHVFCLLGIGPCIFYVFPEGKSALKGTWFKSVKVGTEKAAHVLKELAQKNFQRYFEQWKTRLGRSRNIGGVYNEGANK